MLARRVSAEGRTRAYLGGRSATAADLRDVGAALLSFYGQHEHRRLTLASAQLDILDGFCGAAHAARREAFAAAYARGAGARRRAGGAAGARRRARPRARPARVGARRDRGGRARAEARRPSWRAERERLRHLEGLRRAAARRGRGARARGRRAAARRPRWPAPRARSTRWRASTPSSTRWPTAPARWRVEAEDLAGELRRYGEGGRRGAGPARRGRGAPRGLDRLKRKHGGTIEAVLAHAEACRARRDELAGRRRGAAAGAGRLERPRATSAERAAGCARRARRPRRRARRGGARGARRARHGRRDVRGGLSERAEHGPTGGDEVEFLIAPNPGVPAGPLREIASGRRAVARDARADERRRRGRPGDAGVRRGRRGHRRPDRARGRRAAAHARRRPPGRVHHAPAADRLAGRPPLHDRQGHVGRPGAHDGHAARARRCRGRARAHARAPTATTQAPAGTRRSCSRRRSGRTSRRRHAKELLPASVPAGVSEPGRRGGVRGDDPGIGSLLERAPDRAASKRADRPRRSCGSTHGDRRSG